MQPSFAKGEISPLLFARVDLASYAIGAAALRNMIVLPQGGVTRRPGFERLGDAGRTAGNDCPVRLLPFVYNREDAMVVELTDKRARIWQPSTGSVLEDIASPYLQSELETLKFAQSGNLLFLAHRSHPVRILRRNALSSWTLEEMDFRNGPWMPENGAESAVMHVTVYNYLAGLYTAHSSESYFDGGMVGTLLELNYTVPRKDIEGESLEEPGVLVSSAVEVGNQWHLQTFDAWRGSIEVEKSFDAGESWISEFTYERDDPGAQGQLDISRAEDESNVLYRIRAAHVAGSPKIRFLFTVFGFTKTNVFRITACVSPTAARGKWQKSPDEVATFAILNNHTSDWKIGAWGGVNGYPGAIAFYQERLALAGSRGQPQTIWMSRTGDFADFGISDPLQDDDAINVTLSASDMDGIQALVALDDLLLFTASDEWRLTGAGDNGAITPVAIVAHRQGSNIGCAHIQPLAVAGGIVFVQAHRTEVHALGYDLSSDGYVGSDVSLFSNHLFEWLEAKGGAISGRRIRKMAFQKVPDKLLWFALDDGTAVSCTFQAEQSMYAWARHDTNGRFGDFVTVPREGYDELWAAVRRNNVWGVERMAPRAPERRFDDDGSRYESCVRTLRLNLDGGGGGLLSAKKLLARCRIYTIRSERANLSPANDRNYAVGIAWDYSPVMAETDVQLDNGFRPDAGIEIWVDDGSPLTITGISPSVTPGG